MRIRTQLAVTTTLILVAFAAMTATSAFQQRTLRWLSSGNAAISELTQAAHELAFLSNELLLAPNDRIRTQWRARHASLRELLERERTGAGPFWGGYMSDLVREHEATGQAFERVLAFQARSLADDASGACYSRPSVYVALMLRTRTLLSLLEALRAETQAASLKRIRGMALSTALVDVLALLGGAAMLWLLWRRLVAGMDSLGRGFERVGAGDLDYRLDTGRSDELGDLARGFDGMTARLAGQTRALEQSEARLAEANRELERKVAERTRELDDAVRQLYQAGEELARSERLATMGQLIGAVSHELNNPLMGALNYVEHVRGRITDPKQRQWLTKAGTEIERAAAAVENLVRLGRDGDEHLQSVPVADLVDSALELARPALHQAGAQIIQRLPPGLPQVTAQPTVLRQVLLNLLLNAAEAVHGLQQREVSVSARASGSRVYLAVGDTGPGVAEELRERMFEPFYTTRSARSAPGLGLTLARRLAESNGGTLTYVARPDGGFFELAFPAADAADDIRPSPL